MTQATLARDAEAAPQPRPDRSFGSLLRALDIVKSILAAAKAGLTAGSPA